MNKNDRFRFSILYVAVGFMLAILLSDWIIGMMFVRRPALMTGLYWHSVIWLVSGIFYGYLNHRLLKLAFLAVFAFYLVGNLNAVASYYYYGHHYLTDLKLANFIYSIYALVFTASMVFFERLAKHGCSQFPSTLKRERWDSVFCIIMLLFPVVWFVDQMIAVRGVPPILSGSSIVESMYSTEYGKLYGYGVLLAFSALLMWQKKGELNVFFRCFLYALLLLTIFAMIFDGRRVFLLIFIGALLSYEVVFNQTLRFGRTLLKHGSVLLLVYLGLLFARQGGHIFNVAAAADLFSKVGVEYRDFSFVVTHFLPGTIKGYDFLGSALGGFGNTIALALLGLNKQELVFSGSAYQLAILYKSQFGIRVGVFAEIWLQWGWFGVVAITLLAAAFVGSAVMINKAKTQVGVAFSCVFYGILILMFVGQISAATGYISLLLYLWFLWKFLNLRQFANH